MSMTEQSERPKVPDAHTPGSAQKTCDLLAEQVSGFRGDSIDALMNHLADKVSEETLATLRGHARGCERCQANLKKG